MEYKPPQDIVAVFHASFHPTRGNVLDWHFSADDDLDVEHLGLEFTALPSGLHQLDEDVIYFTANSKHKNTTYYALALFRRRRTSHPLYRGFLLGSLGILVAGPSEHVARATPWKHLPALRDIAERCYSRPGSEPSVLVDIPVSDGEEWFAPAREFFEERRVRGIPPPQIPWTNWKDELHDEVRFWMRSSPCPSHLSSPTLTHITPTLALPSILALLGPLSLTLYRHLLTRKRILIYTKPPVEFACVMCYAAVDMVRSIQQEAQEGYTDDAGDGDRVTVIPPRHSVSEATRVLGMVTLHDLLGSKFSEEEDSDEDGGSGRGWIACTTDALFLEKPSYYDLLIDLTSVGVSSSSTVAFATSKYPTSPEPSSTQGPAPSWMIGPMALANGTRTRPTMYVSVPKHPIPLPVHVHHKNGSGKAKAKPAAKKKKEHRKSTHYKRIQTRWAWSDVRLWGELYKVLRVPPSSGTPTNGDNNSNDNSSTGHGSTGAPTLPTISGTTSNHECKFCGGKVTKQASTTVTSASSSDLGEESGQEPPPTPGAGIGEKPSSPGTGAGAWLADAWQLYEDVCLVCAGALMGTLRTRNLGTGASGEGDGYFTSGGSGNAAAGGFNLKRSVSTPLYAGGSAIPGKMEYRSITMPQLGHRSNSGHGHTRSVSASVAGEAGRKSLGALLEEPTEYGHRESAHSDADPLQAQNLGKTKTSQADFDFTLVAPTADTREGLDMLLNTAAFPGTLAEAVNKTEGVLGVLDGYADWVVGVLRGRVLASVAGAVEVGQGEIEEQGTEGGEGTKHARTSAIELSVTGAAASGGVSRRSPPPPASTAAKAGSGTISKRVKNMALSLTPRDLLALDLNPLSATDVKFLEGLVGEYASRAQVVAMGGQLQGASASLGERSGLGKEPERVTEGGKGVDGKDAPEDVQILEDIHVNLNVKRGWRDLVGVVFGLGS